MSSKTFIFSIFRIEIILFVLMSWFEVNFIYTL